MGGFLCYLFGGETGLGLSAIFIAYFMPFTFMVIFPWAQRISTGSRYSIAFFKEFALNLQNMPLLAVFAALFLHLAGIPRPDINFPLDLLLVISIGLYYFTLGINFDIQDLRSLRKEQFSLAATKFLILPAAASLVLEITELSYTIKSVIILQSFMPAAIYSVVSSILFKLDSRLASGLFVLNSLFFLVLILPVLFFLKGILFF